MRIDPQLEHQHRGDEQDARRKKQGDNVRNFVAVPQASDKSARPRLWRSRLLEGGCGGGHLALQSYY
jgi:hypothetical protein